MPQTFTVISFLCSNSPWSITTADEAFGSLFTSQNTFTGPQLHADDSRVCLWEREGQKASGRWDTAEQGSNWNSIFYPARHLQEEGNVTEMLQTHQIAQAMPTPEWQTHWACCQAALLNLPKKGNQHFHHMLCLTLRAAYSSPAARPQCQALAGFACGVLYAPVLVLYALSSFINFKQNGGM